MKEIYPHLRTGMAAYLVTSLPVVVGLCFGMTMLQPKMPADGEKATPRWLESCSRFDGRHYASIAENGYEFDPHRGSNIAFFPAYPYCGRLIMELTGWSVQFSLLVVANAALAGTFILLSVYSQARTRDTDRDLSTQRGELALLALGFSPASLFFRMTYSESLFMLVELMFLLGCYRKWSLGELAFLAGLGTAIRPVGLAFPFTLMWFILHDSAEGSWLRRIGKVVLVSPLACWGLLVFMGEQWMEFSNPIAFAEIQRNWHRMPLDTPAYEKVMALLTGEPIWGVYTADPRQSWMTTDPHGNPVLSVAFWNPILFVSTCGLVVFGAVRRWLTSVEIILSMGLLLIPYVTKGYDNAMLSHARFAAIVMPAYLVLARWGTTVSRWVMRGWVALAITLLVCWTALFASGHPVF